MITFFITRAKVVEVKPVQSKSNLNIVKMLIETRDKVKDKEDEVNCYEVTLFGKMADEAATIKPGLNVCLNCKLKSRQYEGRWYMELSVMEMYRVGRLGGTEKQQEKPKEYAQPKVNEGHKVEDEMNEPDDDLPF